MNIQKLNEGFISNKGNMSSFKKIERIVVGKISLNGQMSLIENFLKILGTSLKSFKICVFF